MCVKILLAVFLAVASSTALDNDFESTQSDLQTRILNGQDAEEGQFPYQVSLRYATKHHCGASIIDKQWILTAAHCVISKLAKEWKVVVGSISLKQGGVSYDVDKVITHPLYTGKPPWKNNLALFKLKEPLAFSSNINKIPLETYDIGKVNAVVSGWGLVSNFAIDPPSNLQYLQTRTISQFICHLTTNGDQSQICTWNIIAQGVCLGDSGGPLVANGKLVGVVSYVILACGVGLPSVFTKVSYFNKWINSTMDAN